VRALGLLGIEAPEKMKGAQRLDEVTNL